MGRGTGLARKAACAVLPRGVQLRRRLPNGVVVRGANRPGHGGRGVFVSGMDLEPELGRLDALPGSPNQLFVPADHPRLPGIKSAGWVAAPA